MSVSKDGTVHPRHKVLLDGSTYRGRSVMDLNAKRAVRAQKAAKQRQSEDGPSEAKEEAKTEKPVKKEKAKKAQS